MGDTLRDNPQVFKSKVLVTECTFLDKDEESMAHKKGHTHLNNIVKALNEQGDEVKCKQIVLTHFSMKYSEKHILETLEKEIPERFRDRVVAFI
jgi:ribonuclease Z